MYAFLGIIERKNVLRGVFEPSYVLCHGDGDIVRFPYRVIDVSLAREMPLVLVTELYGHDDLIQRISHFRIDRKVSYRGRKRRVQKVVKGMVCWFECSRSGIPTGACCYAADVPHKPADDFLLDKEPTERLLSGRMAAVPLSSVAVFDSKKQLPQFKKQRRTKHDKLVQ